MLVLRRRIGEALALFDAEDGERLLDIEYTGRTEDAIIIETVRPDGERHAYPLQRGEQVNLEGQIQRRFLVVQYSGIHNRKNQATFCIFGARNKIKVFRRELLDRGEGSAKEAKKENDISENQ